MNRQFSRQIWTKPDEQRLILFLRILDTFPELVLKPKSLLQVFWTIKSHAWSRRIQGCFLVTINVFVVFCWSAIKIPGFTFLVVETSFRLWLWLHCGGQGRPLSQTQPILHWQLTNPGSLCLLLINKHSFNQGLWESYIEKVLMSDFHLNNPVTH